MFDIKGLKPQWETVYDHLVSMRIGDVVTDETLAALLPDAPEGSVRSAYRRAVKQMEDDQQRTFDRVRNVGYRMVEAAEQEGLARRHRKRARRQMTTAIRKVHSADRTRLSQADRQRFDALEMNLRAQQEMLARLNAKVRLETQERKADTANLSERVDRLSALLERHGIGTEAQAA